MKKSLLAVAACAAFFVSCKTTEVSGSGLKSEKATVAVAKTTLVDYQGAVLGAEIPNWVVQVAQGQYSQTALKKEMPNLDKKKVFVAIGRGDNLDFVKQWTDLVDIEVEVGDAMQRIVGKRVEASMKGSSTASGDNYDSTEMEKNIAMYKKAVSAVELNGLEKVAGYWVLVQRDYANESRRFYEYYSVWGIDEKKYEKQLAAAMSNVKDNTSEGQILKAAIIKDLTGITVASNSDAVEEEALASFE
ncbi:MAG: hypothetical protein K6B17_01500 [Treponema sp.]|nr:hypothetical protein [Treponema sp.]